MLPCALHHSVWNVVPRLPVLKEPHMRACVRLTRRCDIKGTTAKAGKRRHPDRNTHRMALTSVTGSRCGMSTYRNGTTDFFKKDIKWSGKLPAGVLIWRHTHTLTYALAVGLESKDLLLIHRLGRQWFLLGLGLVGRLDINFRLNPIEA